MYYTHGDTVIFRSDAPRQERAPSGLRERVARKEQGKGREAVPVPAEQALTDRVAQLEARLEKLEVELEQARQAQAASPAPTQSSGPGRRSRGGAGEVKVLLHAEGGAQATVGQVRLLNDE